jgi:hypothetical protein
MSYPMRAYLATTDVELGRQRLDFAGWRTSVYIGGGVLLLIVIILLLILFL